MINKILVFCLLNSLTMFSVVHQYPEDGYYAPADQIIIDSVDTIAALNDFTTPYEILIPKKPALQINVWNRVIASSNGTVNPASGNPYIVINPAWAATLSADEQTALISRYFQQFKDATYPYYVKYYLPYMQSILSFLLIIILSFLLAKMQFFAQQPRYYAIILALVLNVSLQYTLIKKALNFFNTQVVATYYDRSFVDRALKVTHNKQAMISVYEKLLSFTHQSIKDGEKNIEATADSYIRTINYLKNR